MVKKYFRKLMNSRGAKTTVQPEIVKAGVAKPEIVETGIVKEEVAKKFELKFNPELKFGKEKHAGYVYRELVTTEVTYLNNLNILTPSVQAGILARYDNLKMTPQEKEKYVSKEELAKRFEKLNQMKTQQENLLNAFQNSEPNTWTPALQAMQNIYGEYARLLEKMELPPKIDKIDDANALQTTTETLASILISPIQRIPRYKLLAEELEKHTIENDDYAGFKAFHEAAKESAIELNRVKLIAEEEAKLHRVVSTFKNKPSAETFSALLEVVNKAPLADEKIMIHLNEVSFNKINKTEEKILEGFVSKPERNNKVDINLFLLNKVVNDKIITKFEEIMKSTRNKTEKAFIGNVIEKLNEQKLKGGALNVPLAISAIDGGSKKIKRKMSSESTKIEDKYHARAVISHVKEIKKNIKERAKQEPPKRVAPRGMPPKRPASPAPMLAGHKLSVKKLSPTVNESPVSNDVTPPSGPTLKKN